MKIKTGDRRFDLEKYSPELREEALEAVAAGESITAVAREHAIPCSTLARWVKKSDAGDAQFERRVNAELETAMLAAVKAQTAAFTRMAATETLRGASAAELASMVRATHAFVLSIARVMTNSQGDGSAGGGYPVDQWRGGYVGTDDKY